MSTIHKSEVKYVCQSAEGLRYREEAFNTVEECLELFKSFEQADLLDEGDEIYNTSLEQALYRVVDGKLKPLTKGIKNDSKRVN